MTITLQDLQALNKKATPNVFEWDEYDELTEGNIDFIAALVNYYRSGALQRLAELAEDGERFRFLQDLPIVEAQQFFWNWQSRKQRRAAIDSARAPSVKEGK